MIISWLFWGVPLSLVRRVRSRFALAVLISALTGMTGCGGAVPAPKEYVTYHSTDRRFDCDCPQGWETEGGGKPDSPNCWAKLTSGHATIQVTADFAGSLLGDIAKAGAGGMGEKAEPPVARVHPMGQQAMKDEFTNYTERDAVAFQSKGSGEGRRSIFIADHSLGSKVYGYRATLLAGDRRISVVCSCPATNWKELKPAFERITASVRRAGQS